MDIPGVKTLIEIWFL